LDFALKPSLEEPLWFDGRACTLVGSDRCLLGSYSCLVINDCLRVNKGRKEEQTRGEKENRVENGGEKKRWMREIKVGG